MKSFSKKSTLDSFSSGHFFEDLSGNDSFYFKKFFRGLSIYFGDKAVASLCDRPDDKSFRGKNYKIDIWNGCLIPTDREHHANLLKFIKGTVVHPVIEKWLYLPKTSKHFEASMNQLVEMIKAKDVMVGIDIELKTSKPKHKKIRTQSKK